MIQYSRVVVMESRSRGVLDTPLEPVIGLAGGETRWRGMTRSLGGARSPLQRRQYRLRNIRRAVAAAEFHRLDAIGIDLVDGALDALAGLSGGF
jgi:hypothetical protein